MDKKQRQKIIGTNTQKPHIPKKQYFLFIRHLDCGSCNACELELNTLMNPVYDIGQYGIEFVASPRHARLLAITGIFTRNLAEAAQLTLEAMLARRIMTIGDCAKDGGELKNSYAIVSRPKEIEENIIQHIPGCPPAPMDILNGILAICQKRLLK
ncbi:MAG: NADH-quinone oxidoreductase subunit B family protein [Chloroflexota bacterium]